jgi:hypothetical protein
MHKRVSFKSFFYYIQGLGGYNFLTGQRCLLLLLIYYLVCAILGGNRENIIKARHDI